MRDSIAIIVAAAKIKDRVTIGFSVADELAHISVFRTLLTRITSPLAVVKHIVKRCVVPRDEKKLTVEKHRRERKERERENERQTKQKHSKCVTRSSLIDVTIV